MGCQILKKQLEAQSEVKQNRLSNEADEPSTKELLALLLDEIKCTKTENQILKKKLQAQLEKRFMEMFTKSESKLNDLIETTEETKFILQTENKNLKKKLEKLNAHVNALELAYNQTSAKPDTPQQNSQIHVYPDTHKQVNENNECEEQACIEKDNDENEAEESHSKKQVPFDRKERIKMKEERTRRFPRAAHWKNYTEHSSNELVDSSRHEDLEDLNACVNVLELIHNQSSAKP